MLRSSKYTFTLSLYLTEVTGGLKSMGLPRVAHNWAHAHTHTHTHTHIHTHTIWIASALHQHFSSPSLKKVPSEKGNWRSLKINQTPRNLKEKARWYCRKMEKRTKLYEILLKHWFPQVFCLSSTISSVPCHQPWFFSSEVTHHSHSLKLLQTLIVVLYRYGEQSQMLLQL